jgi:hypothetical protein
MIKYLIKKYYDFYKIDSHRNQHIGILKAKYTPCSIFQICSFEPGALNILSTRHETLTFEYCQDILLPSFLKYDVKDSCMCISINQSWSDDEFLLFTESVTQSVYLEALCVYLAPVSEERLELLFTSIYMRKLPLDYLKIIVDYGMPLNWEKNLGSILAKIRFIEFNVHIIGIGINITEFKFMTDNNARDNILVLIGGNYLPKHLCRKLKKLLI